MTVLMRLLRILHSVALWMWLAVWCVAWITLATMVAVVSSETALAMARWFWARPILFLAGARLQVDPLPDVDWDRPHVYVMNHQSNLDIPVAFAVLPANLRFVAKHSLAYVPFLGWYMAITGMIFVNRGDGRKAVSSMRRAGERIRAGANIIVFPEGTRSRDGKVLPFKKGPFALALEARVPIVPVALEGSGAVQPAKAWIVHPGTIRVKVGRPIPTEGRDPSAREALANEVREALVRLHQEIGGRGGGDEVAAPPGEGEGDLQPA
jgi:1-acyl-sn-glycerol-3-phosphate acyltransferase